jgi:hypothetical protein
MVRPYSTVQHLLYSISEDKIRWTTVLKLSIVVEVCRAGGLVLRRTVDSSTGLRAAVMSMVDRRESNGFANRSSIASAEPQSYCQSKG